MAAQIFPQIRHKDFSQKQITRHAIVFGRPNWTSLTVRRGHADFNRRALASRDNRAAGGERSKHLDRLSRGSLAPRPAPP
jgi:hypothetical protein